VGVSSIALLLAALILYLIDRLQIALTESVGLWGEGLRRILEMSFSAVDVDVVGSAALFAAARPRSRS
jgi:hypothetical protein